MRLDIRLVSTLVSPLVSPLVWTLEKSLELNPPSRARSRVTSSTPSITRIDELREDMEIKHSRLLRELQELREELLELPIGNVVKEGGKETRRISNMEEGSVKVVDGNKGKSNRRKEWERTKSNLGSLVCRH